MKVDAKRLSALKTLRDISQGGKKAKDALSTEGDAFVGRDRAFVMELVYGVLRQRDYLDWLIGHFVKDKSGITEDTLNNLRMAIFQLDSLRVPQYAAVFEAVELEKRIKGKPSFVNAVLRNFIRQRHAIDLSSIKDPIKRLAIETSHPYWLTKRWVKRFGLDDAAALASSNNQKPPIALRFKDTISMEKAINALNSAGLSAKRSAYGFQCLLIQDPPPFGELCQIVGERVVIQDEASQLVSLLLNPLPGMRVLDACSAPGGKTTHIADLMNDTGQVYSVESNPSRYRLLRDTIRRLSLRSVNTLCADVIKLYKSKHTVTRDFDRILLDAPCSCIGVIRRNPDIKYRHKEKDLSRFSQRQAEMLDNLSALVKPGGIMAYSVCSTEPEEAEEVIRGFLQRNHSFSNIKSPDDRFNGFLQAGSKGEFFYRTYPHRHGMDGFFIALLRRDR